MKQITIVTSGTGIERASRGLGTSVNDFFGVTYTDLLQGKHGHAKEFKKEYLDSLSDKNKLERELIESSILDLEAAKKSLSYLVDANFYRMHIQSAPEIIAQYSEENLFKWAKVFKDVNRNSPILESIVKDLFINSMSDVNLARALNEQVKVVQIFTACRKKSDLNAFAELVRNTVGDKFIIETLSGDFTTNDQSEEKVKASIKRGKKEGKGVIVLTIDMGSRSFSIPEIQSVILMLDNGSVNQIIQKISRAFTPGKKYHGEVKTVGNIISLSVDSNRIDNIDNLIVREALRNQIKGEDLEKSTRRVLRSVNIFSMDDGFPVRIEEDAYWNELCDKPDISRLADSTTNYENLLNDSEVLDILLDVIGEKAQWVGFTFDESRTQLPTNTPTYKDKLEKALSQKDEPETREEIIKRLRESIYKINTSIGNILEINDLQDKSLKETILDIMKDSEKSTLLKILLGITPKEFTKLIDKGIVNSNLLDVYIKLAIKDINSEWDF